MSKYTNLITKIHKKIKNFNPDKIQSTNLNSFYNHSYVNLDEFTIKFFKNSGYILIEKCGDCIIKYDRALDYVCLDKYCDKIKKVSQLNDDDYIFQLDVIGKLYIDYNDIVYLNEIYDIMEIE